MQRHVFTILLLTGLVIWGPLSFVEAGTFRDDFEDGDLQHWKQFAPPNGPMLWKVVEGELQAKKQGNASTALITGESFWKNYSIEFDVKPVEVHGIGDIHILARVLGFEQILIFNIGDFCAPEGICVGRVPSDNRDVRANSQPLMLNQWYHVKLVADGSQFTLWIDGQEKLTYKDTQAKTGAVGIGITNYTASFDNLVLSGPDVPDVTPPTWKIPFAVSSPNRITTTWGAIKANR